MKLRILIALGVFFGPWIYAFAVVAGNPRSGRGEDGPYTLATYISFITLPASVVLLASAYDARNRRK